MQGCWSLLMLVIIFNFIRMFWGWRVVGGVVLLVIMWVVALTLTHQAGML